MSDLVAALRSMARYDHDDLSIGNDAANRIETLERELEMMTAAEFEQRDKAENLERELAEAKAQLVLAHACLAPLDAIVHELGIENSDDDPVEVLRARVEIERTARLAAEADAAALVEALEHIQEYWNRNTNERAMQDACEFAIYRDGKALAIHGERGRKLLERMAKMKTALTLVLPIMGNLPSTEAQQAVIDALGGVEEVNLDAKEPT